MDLLKTISPNYVINQILGLSKLGLLKLELLK